MVMNSRVYSINCRVYCLAAPTLFCGIKLVSQLVFTCQTNFNCAYLESHLMKSNAHGRTPFFRNNSFFLELERNSLLSRQVCKVILRDIINQETFPFLKNYTLYLKSNPGQNT